MKKTLFSGAALLCAMSVTFTLTAQEAPPPGHHPEMAQEAGQGMLHLSSVALPHLQVTGTPDKPFRVRLQMDESVKPGEVSVTVDENGVHQVRVHPETPHEKIRMEMQRFREHHTPANVMFRVMDAKPAGAPIAEQPGMMMPVTTARAMPLPGARPMVDPDLIQLLQARLRHTVRVREFLKQNIKAGTGKANDMDVSAAELAVKEAEFALKKASQPEPFMPPHVLNTAKVTAAAQMRPGMMPVPRAFPPMMTPPPGAMMPGMPPMPFPMPGMNPELAKIREAYVGQLAAQLLEMQQEFAEADAAFKMGDEKGAAPWLRTKIVYLDAAIRFYREASVHDRFVESVRDRAKAAMMLVRVLEENTKADGLSDEDRAEAQRQLKNARIIAAEATEAFQMMMPGK